MNCGYNRLDLSRRVNYEPQQEVIRQIAHDLNNMLTPAVIATDMLQRDYSDKSENEQELISLIHSALSDAAHLVSVMKPLQSDTEPVGNIEELRPHSFCGYLERVWPTCEHARWGE